MEQYVTKVFYVGSKCSVAKMKQEAVLAHRLPKSRVAVFDFVFDHGHHYVYRGFSFRKGEVMEKPLNRFHMGKVFKDTCQIVMRPVGGLAGGGIPRMTKKDAFEKKKQEVAKKATKLSADIFKNASNVVAKSHAVLKTLYDQMEEEPETAFTSLLQLASDEAIGTDESNSALLTAIKSGVYAEDRMEKFIGLLTKSFLKELSDMMMEGSGILESSDLTIEMIMVKLFMKESTKWDWKKIRGHITDEQKYRARVKNQSVENALANMQIG